MRTCKMSLGAHGCAKAEAALLRSGLLGCGAWRGRSKCVCAVIGVNLQQGRATLKPQILLPTRPAGPFAALVV